MPPVFDLVEVMSRRRHTGIRTRPRTAFGKVRTTVERSLVRVPATRLLRGHRYRVSPGRIWTRERGLALALLAVVGPGVLAGLSDDDPAGITTYSILGADFGYRLLWTLLVSTAALVLFHDLTVRLGIATGKGLVSVIRMRYGAKAGFSSAGFLIIANLGTTAAEMAGIAAGLEIGGVSRYVSVPVAAAAVTTLVLAGTFHRVELVLLVISSVFITYIASGILAHPQWGQAARGLVVPDLPFQRHAILVATATLGTTLAPWGLAFIQSYAVDKKLRPSDWKFERIDVVVGAVATGVIGVFVVVACAETLYRSHTHINDASDAAVALTPLAGHLASTLFAVGLVGAGLLAAAILPLSTSYSVSEAFGKEGRVDGNLRTEPIFFSTYIAMTVVAAAIVLIPGAPLVPILFLTQAVNAVMLLPLLAMIAYLTRDPELMGELRIGTVSAYAAWVTTALITITVVALGLVTLLPGH
jgi:NRAMP (natural resistance-associated macrophage protein)-like metal ion transporter